MAAPSDSGSSAQAAGSAEGQQPFPAVFWVANWMELVERFAYYGLRTVVPIYMVLAYEQGGPQFSHTQKGTIFAVWALVQSFVPIFTGGFADRYGYKLSIGISTAIKITGYLVMGYAIEIATLFTGEKISEVGGAAGGSYTYPVFFAGAMLLAGGTAIFKPGVQGLIGATMPQGKGALGWSVFYQAVNIGGFLGPAIAAVLQLLDWKYVFLACTFGIALNFVPLFFFAEPPRKKDEGFGGAGPLTVLKESLIGLLAPRVFFFTICFAGFWLMFYQLFDILPNFIDDWVNSREVSQALLKVLPDGWVPVYPNGNLNQAWMINLNALLISLFAFAFGWVTGKMRSLPAIVIGILISCLAIYMLGMSMNGWWTLFAIGVFSMGEMTASPTKLRYMASIAPPGRKGLFLGYANATVGIGWFVGSLVAGTLYEEGGDKANLAMRELLAEEGRAGLVQQLSERELIEGYAAATGLSHLQTMELVFHPERLEPAENSAALLEHFKEEDLLDDGIADEPAATAQQTAADLSEKSLIPERHVLRLPQAAAGDTGAVQVAAARELMRAYEPTREEVAEIDDEAVLQRLATLLDVSGYAAARILYTDEIRSGAVSLAEMQEYARELLAASESIDVDGLPPEEIVAKALDELGNREVLAILALVNRVGAGEVATLEELESALDEISRPVPEELLFARELFLTRAERELQQAEDPKVGEKEADKAITSLFLRSHVVELLAAKRDETEKQTTRYLWEKYEPYSMWAIFAAIGLASMMGLLVYDAVCKRYDARHGIVHSKDV